VKTTEIHLDGELLECRNDGVAIHEIWTALGQTDILPWLNKMTKCRITEMTGLEFLVGPKIPEHNENGDPTE
jgi:hypothetical protein